jgi:perosamine synthetase
VDSRLPPMLPIAKPSFGREEEEAVVAVLRSGWVTQGEEVAAFEREFADYCGVGHAVAVANCTVAMHLAMHAYGIGPGDEVITVSHSFIATANAVRHTGATPVFVDISLDDFNIDPGCIEAAITGRTRAIMVVHQLGMPCRLTEAAEVAAKHKLILIEDAACAIGSELRLNGTWRRIGAAVGGVACFSFHPRKLLTTGDGGMLTTDDGELAARLRRLRQHAMSVNDRDRHLSGQVAIESYLEPGFNYRMTDIQAAVGRCQLARIPDFVAKRRLLAGFYGKHLSGIDGLVLPQDRDDTKTNFQSYCVLLPTTADQRQVMQAMLDRGISTRRGVMCAHREPAYAGAPGIRFPLPASEAAQDRGLILPLYDSLTEDDVIRVARGLAEALAAPQVEGRSVGSC